MTKFKHTDLCIGGDKGPCNCGAVSPITNHEGLGRITPLQPNYISDILNDNSHIQKKINEIIAKVNILIELKNGELAGRPTPTAAENTDTPRRPWML